VIVPDRAIVLCPNHTGLGRPLAVMAEGEWETPIGPVPIDRSLARRLLDLDPELADDALAHSREHALEVQLPFLRILSPALRIVPICVGTSRLASLLALGDAIAAAVRETAGGGIGAAAQDATAVGEPLATDLAEEMIVGSSPMPEARCATTDAGATEPHGQRRRDQILVVISSDMSHYIPFEEARELDAMAIERMEELDAEGLHSVVEREEISMCGAMPAVAGLRAARALGASRGRLVAYTSSGDRTGDYREVVAYAGMVFH
jgi:predicted class III extradiol MEMO1 family dioxygenase